MQEKLISTSDEGIELLPDSGMPTEQERRKLCLMLDRALIDIRGLGKSGKAVQAADSADAFHNVPGNLWNEHFSFGALRMFLESYHASYPARGWYFNYPGMPGEIMEESFRAPRTPSNNGMHPTPRHEVSHARRVRARVMPGFMPLLF